MVTLEEKLIEIWSKNNTGFEKPDLIEIDEIIPHLNSGTCEENPVPNILRGYLLHENLK